MITTVPLRVRMASTVVCIRKAQSTAVPVPLFKKEATGGGQAWAGAGGDGPARLEIVFGDSDSVNFPSGWEVLLGQNEVQNWVRSSPGKVEAMRYPGEWKFAGGLIEPGETPEDAARRELEEEFQIRLPRGLADCKLHLLSVKQTRPIRDVSNIMYNFVAASEENPWLMDIDIDEKNQKLAGRREEHQKLVENGRFWAMDREAREQVSPEIRQIQWLSMREAVLDMFQSMNDTFVPVNGFQKQEFERFGLVRRDPMYLTMATLLEVESFPSVPSIVRYSKKMDRASELQRVQWLHAGMTPEEVYNAWNANISPSQTQRKGMFATAEELAELRARRLREDASWRSSL